MERKSKWQRQKPPNPGQDVAGVVGARMIMLAEVDVTGLPMIYAVDAISKINRTKIDEMCFENQPGRALWR